MSKKFLKQLGNVVVLQAVGYAVGEAFRVVGPKVKKAMGLEEDDSSSEPAKKEERKAAAKESREDSKEINDLIAETKASVAKKKEEQPPVDAKDSEEE